MTPFTRAVVGWALKQVGKPYIWAGRGDYVLRDGKRVSTAAVGVDGGLVFDCSGLVTAAIKAASGVDLTLNWNADRLWRQLPVADEETDDGDDNYRLRFYGPKQGPASHVAITLGNGLIIEAAGGDSKTLTYKDALMSGACVAVRFETRVDVKGNRSLNAARRLKP